MTRIFRLAKSGKVKVVNRYYKIKSLLVGLTYSNTDQGKQYILHHANKGLDHCVTWVSPTLVPLAELNDAFFLNYLLIFKN